uniref:Uncharacterized protein n=1 Tax=viral metagenome TaxID=1070528 RepID=A0A6C0KR29_9ZZZZ
MSELKVVNLTGGAAAEFMGGVKKKKRATRKKQEGGDAKGMEASMTHSAGSTDPSKWLHHPTTSVPPVIQVQKSIIATPAQVAAPTQQYAVPIPPHPVAAQAGGSVKHIKVELKKKPATKKVQLHPKKAEPSKTSKRVTRKSRKLTLGVSSLHKRMTRAKKMHKTVKEMPLDKLKEELVKKKLIKPTSKAPESVLRQIAADAQIVAGKAL